MSTRTSTYKKDCNHIEIDLRDILEVDTERMVVRVEPLANMGQFVDTSCPWATRSKSWSKWKTSPLEVSAWAWAWRRPVTAYGLIQETVVAYEIVTADGTLMRVTKDSDPELFHALPWSHGTLGFLVALELRDRAGQTVRSHEVHPLPQHGRALREDLRAFGGR